MTNALTHTVLFLLLLQSYVLLLRAANNNMITLRTFGPLYPGAALSTRGGGDVVGCFSVKWSSDFSFFFL